jgi:DNA-directed RNA polymerase subunit beta
LVRPEAPVVGTGIEHEVVRDSRFLVIAEADGVVDYVDSNEIVVKYVMSEEEKFVRFDGEVSRYKLLKYRKTNQNTCINLKPIVRKGDKVTRGQILTEGYSTSQGELALGRNLMVAFMPWKGYNLRMLL